MRTARGMVTAELAVATLAALALTVLLCWAIYLVVMQMRCIDVAGEVARQAARHDDQAVRIAKRDAPAGADVRVHSSRTLVSVTVRIQAPGLVPGMPKVPLSAHAEVIPEPEEQS